MQLTPITRAEALEQDLQALSQLAHLANDLAKRLKGTPHQGLAYKMKAVALSSLVTNGVASPNGIHPNKTVGLDFFGSRLHCPVSALSRHAQGLIHQAERHIPATAPICDRLKPEQLDALVRRCRDIAA